MDARVPRDVLSAALPLSKTAHASIMLCREYVTYVVYLRTSAMRQESGSTLGQTTTVDYSRRGFTEGAITTVVAAKDV